MSTRGALVRDVYLAFSVGQLEGPLDHMADGVRWHAPVLALELEGKASVRDRIADPATCVQLGLTEEPVALVEQDELIVALLDDGVADGSGRATSCHVFRFEGDLIAEVWALGAARGGAAGVPATA